MPAKLDTSQPLFVSVRSGALVTRFTLAGKASGLIGVVRGEGGAFTWRPEAIVMLPAEEVSVHRVPYGHALAQGDLVRRTEAEYQAQLAAQRPRGAPASASRSTSAAARARRSPARNGS